MLPNILQETVSNIRAQFRVVGLIPIVKLVEADVNVIFC